MATEGTLPSAALFRRNTMTIQNNLQLCLELELESKLEILSTVMEQAYKTCGETVKSRTLSTFRDSHEHHKEEVKLARYFLQRLQPLSSFNTEQLELLNWLLAVFFQLEA